MGKINWGLLVKVFVEGHAFRRAVRPLKTGGFKPLRFVAAIGMLRFAQYDI
jgi:hypothetical protein